MDIPVKPTVPPAPSALNPVEYPARHDAWAASISPVVDYVDESLNQIAVGIAEVAATANLGDLPPLTGHAGKFFRVNSSATAVEFNTAADHRTALGLGPAATFTPSPSGTFVVGDVGGTFRELTAAEGRTAIGGVLGHDQTPQDVTASRAGGITYQNTTGRPIFVNIYARSVSTTSAHLQVSVDGVTWTSVAYFPVNASPAANVSWVVPPNYYYRTSVASLAASPFQWTELR